MFHAELANKTVQAEITDLMTKQHNRHEALMQSDEELKRDHLDLMSFISEDNVVKREKEKREKQLLDKRQEKEETLKRLDRNIQMIKSDIAKNKDYLKGLN